MDDASHDPAGVSSRGDEARSGRHGDGDGGARGGYPTSAQEERDNAPLVPAHSRHSSLGTSVIALEVSSSGEGAGEDLVLDDDRWRWRHTVSYWVCICFILGSLLFVAGCAFWYKRWVGKKRIRFSLFFHTCLAFV